MKWTPPQKRADPTAYGDSMSLASNGRITPISRVLDSALRHQAQLNLAEMALEKDDPVAWLGDVLDVLDLRARIKVKKMRRVEACVPYTGSMRGYNTHLRTYTYPCTACNKVRESIREAEQHRLGYTTEEVSP